MICPNENDNIELRMIESMDDLSPQDLENLLKRKRLDMARKDVLKKFPIKQLPMPDGRYWVRVDGKQFFRKTREELEDLIWELQKQEDVTICKIFPEYFERRKVQVASGTWVNDKKYYRMYIENSTLGNKAINKLTIEDGYEFFEYVKSVKPDLKEKYWKNVKSCLDMIIKYCIQRHYIEYHPFEYLQFHSSQFKPAKETSDEDTVFSKEEQKEVCSIAKAEAEDLELGIPLGIPLLFNTGLRMGELIVAKWCDITNINGKPHLYIRRIQVGSVEDDNIRGRETADRCKSKRSKRKVPLNSECIRLLDDIKKYNKVQGFSTGDNDYIFYRKVKGNIVECTERCFAGRLRRYCRMAGMEVLKSPHDVRRTALTNLWLSGVPIKAIQFIAGHNSQKQTEDYIRITEKDMSQFDYTELLVDDAKGFDVPNNGQDKIVQFRKRA